MLVAHLELMREPPVRGGGQCLHSGCGSKFPVCGLAAAGNVTALTAKIVQDLVQLFGPDGFASGLQLNGQPGAVTGQLAVFQGYRLGKIIRANNPAARHAIESHAFLSRLVFRQPIEVRQVTTVALSMIQ